jgi:hypothetical protein
VTATGSLNSIPCSFRSSAVEFDNISCSLATIERRYPAQPPKHFSTRASHHFSQMQELYEVPNRGDSDWTIHRGAGVFLEGVAHSSITSCIITHIGSNAVFISNAAHNITIAHNEISQVGESAVAVMGVLTQSTGLSALNYPRHINISANHVHHIGIYGKQAFYEAG